MISIHPQEFVPQDYSNLNKVNWQWNWIVKSITHTINEKGKTPEEFTIGRASIKQLKQIEQKAQFVKCFYAPIHMHPSDIIEYFTGIYKLKRSAYLLKGEHGFIFISHS